MIERLHILIDENYVARIRTSEAELKHLQSQIQPHFLYNSLFSIKQMAEVENVELIQEFTDYLGQYFRYMSRDSHTEVSLGAEIDHALVYASIQKSGLVRGFNWNWRIWMQGTELFLFPES